MKTSRVHILREIEAVTIAAIFGFLVIYPVAFMDWTGIATQDQMNTYAFGLATIFPIEFVLLVVFAVHNRELERLGSQLTEESNNE
jgi:hypothetical protein